METSVVYKVFSFPSTLYNRSGRYYSFSQIRKWRLRGWGACLGSPKWNGRAVVLIRCPVPQVHVDSLLYSSLWKPRFSRSRRTFESFPIEINLYLWNCLGQLLFHMHVLLITMSCVSIAHFSEKIQAHSRHSSLISSDSGEAGLDSHGGYLARSQRLWGNLFISGIPGTRMSLRHPPS